MEHVTFAYNFFHRIYTTSASGYAQLSEAEQDRSTLRNSEVVVATLQGAGELLGDLVEGLLEHRQIAARDLMDYAGLDLFQARSIISELVRHRALVKEYGYYIKKPAFRILLQKLKHHLTQTNDLTAFVFT
jgi:hypothetical protein